MSFLKVMIPAESIDSLLEDIRKQLEAGRFYFTHFSYNQVIETPTKELKRLIEILQRELQVRLRSIYMLVNDQG